MLISVLILLVIILAVFRVGIANRAVESSEKLKNLDREISALEAENQLRAEKLRVKASLTHLEPKAQEAGFQKTGNYAFVEKTGPVAVVLNEL